jgi:hypothetical protein
MLGVRRETVAVVAPGQVKAYGGRGPWEDMIRKMFTSPAAAAGQ